MGLVVICFPLLSHIYNTIEKIYWFNNNLFCVFAGNNRFEVPWTQKKWFLDKALMSVSLRLLNVCWPNSQRYVFRVNIFEKQPWFWPKNLPKINFDILLKMGLTDLIKCVPWSSKIQYTIHLPEMACNLLALVSNPLTLSWPNSI